MNRRNAGQFISASSLLWLGLFLVLLLNFSIRWHLRELPLERDEGEYAYAGQLILQHVPPYQVAWNMKFPGVYYAYAGLMSIFGETPAGIHEGIILVTTISILLVFLIGCELMSEMGGLIAATLFTLLTALPFAYGLAGHATHFVVLFVCLGTLALLKAGERRPKFWLCVSGLAFGISMLMKQHALLFVLAAMQWQLWTALRRKEKFVLKMFLFAIATAVPLVVMLVGMAALGVWDRFNLWTIQYAREYASLLSIRTMPVNFWSGFRPIFDSAVWIWFPGLIGLVLVFFRRWRTTAILPATGLFLAGLVATAPGFYFRGHYFLMVMPGLALLTAALLLAIANYARKFPHIQLLKLLPLGLFVILVADMVVRNFDTWFEQPLPKISRTLYGSSPFVESPIIADYIRAHSKPADTVAVLGSEPQIFFLAHRRSASGYIYFYPLTEPQRMAAEMGQEFKQEVETAKPAYVVNVTVLSSWCSIKVPDYTLQVIDGFQKWWTDYSTNYQLAGLVDLDENGSSDFYWDGQLSQRTNSEPAAVSIYRRRGN